MMMMMMMMMIKMVAGAPGCFESFDENKLR